MTETTKKLAARFARMRQGEAIRFRHNGRAWKAVRAGKSWTLYFTRGHLPYFEAAPTTPEGAACRVTGEPLSVLGDPFGVNR